MGRPSGGTGAPMHCETHTWPGTSGDSVPPHRGLSKPPAAEEQTAVQNKQPCSSLATFWELRRAVRGGWIRPLSPGLQQGFLWLQPAPRGASSCRQSSVQPHTQPRSESGLQGTAWKGAVKDAEEYLEERIAYPPTSHHPHPSPPFLPSPCT